MKFAADRPWSDPEKAARKLLEIANDVEAVQDGRIYIEHPKIFYIVVNHFGRFGAAFVETDLDRADYETTIADLMTGQHSDPLRGVRFNPVTDRAEDVSHAIAQEILRRLDLEGRNVPSELERFIERQAGRDRQLTLRLA